MKINAATALRTLVLCLPLAGACAPHTHEEAGASAEADELEALTTTVFGEQVLLFMENPPLVRGESARFLAHLSVLATGEPIRSGRVTLTIGPTALEAEGPKRDGLFIPEGSFDTAGRFPARLVLTSGQAEESLDLGEVVVHGSEEEARRAAEADESVEPPGAVPFLMEQQWKLRLLLAEAGPRTLSRRLVVPAQVRTPEGLEAAVVPPVAGRLSAPEGGAFPRSGDEVEAGQVLGFVEPSLSAIDWAQLQALQLELDLKALEVVRAADEAQARLDFARREHERVGKLREHRLSTEQDLDTAERNLALARSEAEAAGATRSSLERLQASRGERAGAAGMAGQRLAIIAPIAGTVIAVGRVTGAFVHPEDELVRIRDTSRVWVEGRVSEFDLHRLGGAPSAAVTLVALPEARFEVAAGALRLLPSIDPESRTALLRCELPNEGGELRSGMLAELAIATGRVEAAVAVPVEAVVMDQGVPSAYVMLEGELFQRRELELGIKDGGWVEVKSGLLAAERVATRGAYLVKLAALSPASFGAGHQH